MPYRGVAQVRQRKAAAIPARAEGAGLPHFSPHGLRHTFANLYLTEAPSPDVYYLSPMLGHASIQETVDTYGRWLPANRKGALDALDDAPLATTLQPTRS